MDDAIVIFDQGVERVVRVACRTIGWFSESVGVAAGGVLEVVPGRH
jgi:hypothetical protein